MFNVDVELFDKNDGSFAGIFHTVLPQYFYNDNEFIVDIDLLTLRRMIPDFPQEVHYLVRVAE